MSYTRLSSNFQPKTAPKTALIARRQVFSGFLGLSAFMLWPDLAVAGAPPTAASTPPISTSILDKDGEALRLDRFRGTPLLINFWATWCPPCVAELPALDTAAKQLGDDVTVLLISVDRGGSKKALPFLQDRGISRPEMAFDAKAALSREMGVRGLPTTFLLSADQQQSWAYVGPREWDSAAMIAEIRALLQTQPAAA
ncbi:MAG: TlpA family protein disulfide reductase [Candidatus Puniceispirillaceae bacterium]